MGLVNRAKFQVTMTT